jgi:hypothetical protein
MWFVRRTRETASCGEARYVWESSRALYGVVPFAARGLLMEVGVGLGGLICGGARALAESANCSLGLEASCIVKEPSDHRSTRAFD